jgi:citrate lyase beta subunit
VNSGQLELFVFTVDPGMAGVARDAGIDALVVDWEWRGKCERQEGADTEVNRDTPEHLAALASFSPMRRVCRLNAFGPWTAAEVELAVGHGATDVLLPMVESAFEVEAFLSFLDGRARAGILVETDQACRRAEELARLPVDLVYVGLNDLAVERRSSALFLPLVDGTAERLRQVFSGCAFGLAGLTVLDAGHPVPCRRLIEEMARLGCDFTFLRRSFRRDVAGRDVAREVARLRSAWERLRLRDAAAVEAAHGELRCCLERLYGSPGRTGRRSA